MRRRDFVKGILAASAAARAVGAQQVTQAPPAATPLTSVPHGLPPAGPTPWMTGLMEVKPLDLTTVVPDAVAQTEAHFFNQVETQTLRRLCQVLMPPLKGYPGALETGAPEFLDFLVGVSPQPRQQMYLAGLGRLDAEAHKKFDVPFAKATDEQADALIRPWLRAWMSDHPPTEPHARFINLAHSDIRKATVNSQEWSDAVRAAGRAETEQDLYWYPIDPDLRREASAALRRASAAAGPA